VKRLTVTLTGTGVPMPAPGRAGAGVLVRHGELALQFDAGRATTQRLVDVGVPPRLLDAVFLTHLHSDHVVDLPDVVMTRWIERQLHGCGPLVVVAPEGGPARFVARMLDPFDDDIEMRTAHVGTARPWVDLRAFPLPDRPADVWSSEDGTVVVKAVRVHHEPVTEAVAFRVETPDGVVVVSGDTRVCREVERLCEGADVVVHEACRATALRDRIAGTAFEPIFDYHADTVALGAMAQRSGVPHVVLTHLIPPPGSAEDEVAFAQDLRDGGYTGQVTVGADLCTIDVTPRSMWNRPTEV
jgi:ribonuclease Z